MLRAAEARGGSSRACWASGRLLVKATFGTDSGVWEFPRGDFESNLQILKPETDMEIRESEINHLLYCR